MRLAPPSQPPRVDMAHKSCCRRLTVGGFWIARADKAPAQEEGLARSAKATRVDNRVPRHQRLPKKVRRSREGDRRRCSGLWGISLDGHVSDGRLWGEQLAGPTEGRVGACVWRAGAYRPRTAAGYTVM